MFEVTPNFVWWNFIPLQLWGEGEWSPSIQSWRHVLLTRLLGSPQHTHTLSRKQRHKNKNSRMQGKRSKVRNFPSEERKQKQKSLLTSKIRKQKINDKKVSDPGRDRPGKLSAIVDEKPWPVYTDHVLLVRFSCLS